MFTSLHVVILLIGSITLSKKIRELATSVKTSNKEKIKVDIFFLVLTVLVIALLIFLVASSRSTTGTSF
jgi:hypothetical protein